MVNPFILRRTKKEVLKELPDKVDHKYMLEFSASEKKLYLANLAMVNKEMQAKMKEVHFDRIAILAMLTKLRQICCDARLVYDNIKEPSTKINATTSLIKTLTENNKKILLFSAFTSLLDLVSNQLDKEQISYYMLTGSTNKEERRKLVNNFNEDDTRVFLISLKAGGTGLNLTSAEAVIHIDPWWNLSAQNQATDRAHRIGQNANVQVYRMIMKDSIEEKILKMQERKANLADSFVEGNDGSLSKMSKEEILRRFELQKINNVKKYENNNFMAVGEENMDVNEINDFINSMECKFTLPEDGGKAIWEITHNCNYGCSYCIFSCDKRRVDGELTTEECFHVIDELVKNGFKHLKITGGEPFIRKDLVEILKYASKKLIVDVSTNASLINDEIVNELNKINLKMIHVSLDGNKEEHEAVRGKLTYERTINGLKALKNSKNKVRIGSVIHAKNENNLENLITYLLRYQGQEVRKPMQACLQEDF